MENFKDDNILNQLEQFLLELTELQKQGIGIVCFSDEELIKLKPLLNDTGFLDTYNDSVLQSISEFVISEADTKEIKDWIILKKSSNANVDEIEVSEMSDPIMYKLGGFTAAIIGIIGEKNKLYMCAFDMSVARNPK